MSTARDIKNIVLNAIDLTCEDDRLCPYTNEEFIMNLNDTVDGTAVDMVNKDLTSYTNLKKKVYDIKMPNTPGTRGYQGRYKLEDDILQLKKVEVSLDGKCWVEATATTKDLKFKYECNNCPCKGPTCGMTFRLVNNYLEIEPIPYKPVKKGLVVWYEALPEKITDIDQEVSFERIDHMYIAMQIADYYMAIHADKFSQAKVNRFFNKYNQTRTRFNKRRNLQTRGRVQRKHTRPYI